MKSQYDNLETICNDSRLLFDSFLTILGRSFDPKYYAEPSTLAACIRIASSKQNLDYFGGYCLKRISNKENLKSPLPINLIHYLEDKRELEVSHLDLGSYILKACKNGRLPLSI